MSSRSQAPRPTSSTTAPWAIGYASSRRRSSVLSIWSNRNGRRRTSRSGVGGVPCVALSFRGQRSSCARSDRRSVAGVVPGPTDPDTDLQRDVHLDGRTHLLAYQRLDRLTFARRDLQDKLVVNLEQNSRGHT